MVIDEHDEYKNVEKVKIDYVEECWGSKLIYRVERLFTFPAEPKSFRRMSESCLFMKFHDRQLLCLRYKVGQEATDELVNIEMRNKK